MSDYGIPETEVKACIDAFDRQTKKDDEKERNYLTYEEMREALEEVLGSKFKRDNIFFKLVSELENLEPNRVRFLDFLEVYKKYGWLSQAPQERLERQRPGHDRRVHRAGGRLRRPRVAHRRRAADQDDPRRLQDDHRHCEDDRGCRRRRLASPQNGNKEIEFGEFKQLLDTNDKEVSADDDDKDKDIDEFFEI